MLLLSEENIPEYIVRHCSDTFLCVFEGQFDLKVILHSDQFIPGKEIGHLTNLTQEHERPINNLWLSFI